MKRKMRDIGNTGIISLPLGFVNRHKRILIPALAAILLLVSLFAFIKYLYRGLPSLTQLEHYEPELVTRIYSADNKVIKELYIQRRVFVPLDRIPQNLINAVIDTEDRRFWNHWGIDTIRFLKALIVDIIHLSPRQGASTLTQQLARNLYLTYEKTLIRKLKEQITAIQIERTYSKNEILEMYLNQMYFGHGAYGVQSAARRFFGKDVTDLTLEECALLVGVLPAQNYYSPFRNPDRALRRRNLVLRNMYKLGHISEAEFREAVQKPLQLRPREEREAGDIAPYFTEYVRQKLQEKYGRDLYTGGLSVYTTLDTRVQACGERAVKQQLPALQKSVEKYVLSKGLFQKLVDPALLEEKKLATLLADSAFVDSLIAAKAAAQVALVAIDPHNGHILAMIGGRDFSESKFNRAVQAKRQPGSAFKPFIYTAVIDNGYSPTFQRLNQPVVLLMPDGTRWIPHNYDNSQGGPTTLREALAKSLNLVTVRLVQEVARPQIVVDYAKKLGLTTNLRPVDAIALGTSEVIPLEITSAFGVFANKGVRVEPIAVLKIVDKNGTVIEENVPRRKEVLRQETAYIMVDLLKSVMTRGTGYTARTIYNFYRPAGGKTGTTDDFTDAWFIGFTPQIVAGVWVGVDDPSISLGDRQAGAVAALPIWARFMKSAHDTLQLPVVDFQMPEGVVRLKICNETKKLATEFCPDVVEEVFDAKVRPSEYCDKHVAFGRRKFATEDEAKKKSKQRVKIQF